MALDVSLIVPFFNPGADIEDCLASLVAQTLSAERFEVILVDDGSTDGSVARVDEWVTQHPDLIAVHHITASGAPGRPRNVGIDAAAGRYVQFVDSDDTLAPRALERMLELADASDADVVVGKLSSDFRGIHQPFFRGTVTGRTLDDFPLMLNLTVCKMFRREFLSEHGVRFPEGPHYIEDQNFCMQAYVHASSVAIVGDTACYFYRRRRTSGGHRGDATISPVGYFDELEQIFDLVDTNVTSPATRSMVLSRFYRNEMLGRLRGPAMVTYGDHHRRDLVAHVRRLAVARIPPEVRDALPALLRIQSRLLIDDDLDGLLDFARRLETVRLRAGTTPPSWRDGRLIVDVDATLWLADEPLRLERDDEGWLLPQVIAPGVDAGDRRLGPSDDADLDLDLATISRLDSQLWSTTEGLAFTIDDDGTARIGGKVELDPASVMGGQRLTSGAWAVRLRVIIAGLSRTAALVVTPDAKAEATWLTSDSGELRSVTATASSTLLLDVDQWSRALHDVVADQFVEPPHLAGDRRLTIAADGLRGPHQQAHASLILEPLDLADEGLVTCGSVLRIGPAGATVDTDLPSLPTGVSRWALWLRIGDIGGAPPRRLPFELRQAAAGDLSVEAALAGAGS
jgi:glycosyltransferase involved in cell wall biosynthesis